MSYEGYTEYLCRKGHYNSCDCHDEVVACTTCGAEMAWQHSVDTTNGYSDAHQGTCCAPKRERGFDDQWQVDHYGNRYAIKLMRYDPVQFWTAVELSIASEDRWGIQLLLRDGQRWRAVTVYDPATYEFETSMHFDSPDEYHVFDNEADAKAVSLQIWAAYNSRDSGYSGLGITTHVVSLNRCAR